MNQTTVTAVIARRNRNTRRVRRGALLIGAFTALLLFISMAPAGEDANTAAKSAQRIGVFVGHDAAGLAVYRLPTVHVAIDRKAAQAALGAEESP